MAVADCAEKQKDLFSCVYRGVRDIIKDANLEIFHTHYNPLTKDHHCSYFCQCVFSFTE